LFPDLRVSEFRGCPEALRYRKNVNSANLISGRRMLVTCLILLVGYWDSHDYLCETHLSFFANSFYLDNAIDLIFGVSRICVMVDLPSSS
jgi:hypothetical protein